MISNWLITTNRWHRSLKSFRHAPRQPDVLPPRLPLLSHEVFNNAMQIIIEFRGKLVPDF